MSANYGGWLRKGFSQASGVSLTTTPIAALLGGADATYPRADRVPGDAELRRLVFRLSSISGATAVSFFLARDAAGDEPVTVTQTETIQTGLATVTDGFVLANLDEDFLLYDTPAPGADVPLYVIAWANTGTAQADVFLHWRG